MKTLLGYDQNRKLGIWSQTNPKFEVPFYCERVKIPKKVKWLSVPIALVVVLIYQVFGEEYQQQFLGVYLFKLFVFLLITVRLLEPGHLEEHYPITTVLENTRFSSFFANGPTTYMNLRAVS